MLTSMLQKAILIFIGILFLISLALIYFRARNVKHKERIQIFKSADYLNAVTILLCFVITISYGVFNHIELKKSVNSIISLNYAEASQALNSNGSRFNMSEILCDEVIERAIEKGALKNVTAKQLRDTLVAYPSVQGGVANESQYHISTEFVVEYHASKHTDHLDSENVIKLITTAYKEYYIEKYTDNFKLDEEKPDFESMEYMDIVTYLNKEASAVLNYLYGMAEKNPSFVSENGNTFDSLAGRVYQYKETQINKNLYSLILQNGIAKEKAQYLDRLSYQNTNTDFTRQKNQASYDLCNQAIAMYSKEMTRIVLVPTWDKTGKYYMGRTKVGIDELSILATTFSEYVAGNEKEIMSNDLVIGKMADGGENEGLYSSADQLIDSIYSNIKEFEKEAVQAGKEYSNRRMNQCISLSIYGTSIISELKTLVIFAAFSYVALMLNNISKKFPKKK